MEDFRRLYTEALFKHARATIELLKLSSEYNSLLTKYGQLQEENLTLLNRILVLERGGVQDISPPAYTEFPAPHQIP